MGNNIATLSAVEVNGNKTAVWSVVIGQNKGYIVIAVEHHIVVVKALKKGLETLLACATIEDTVA
jgi:hypothetical protein